MPVPVQARGISTVVKPTSAASIGDVGRLKAEKTALEEKLDAAQQALREMREQLQSATSRRGAALGRGANAHASTNPGKPGQLAKQNTFAIDKHLSELREVRRGLWGALEPRPRRRAPAGKPLLTDSGPCPCRGHR